MNRIQKITCLITLCICLVLMSCSQTIAPKNGSFEQIHKELVTGEVLDKKISKKPPYVPSAVRYALIPAMHSNSYGPATPSEHRFDIAADKLPAKSFFMGLVEGTPYNMVVSPNVTGTISLNLKHVTIEEAMDAVRDIYGFDYRCTSYGYEVLPPELQTQIFVVNYIDVKRKGKSLTEMSSGEVSQQLSGAVQPSGTNTSNYSNQSGGSTTNAAYVPISSIDTTSELNFWKSLESTLSSMIGNNNGRSVTVNAQSGVILVRAYPLELRQIARYLDRIQSNMNRQVILEAKILEVQLNDQFQSGINWNLFGKGFINNLALQQNDGGVNQISTQTFDNTDLKDFTGIFALNVKGDFGTLIKLLQTQGNVQVLSSPRISTVNNQKAVIKVGQDEFFVTGVSSTTTVSGSATIPTQNVTLTPFFSGVTLDVTPQISRNGFVILHIHPTVSRVKTQEKDITVGTVIGTNSSGATTSAPNTLSLPMALSDIRESDNVVRASNQQVVVIGGLMQNNMVEEIGGTPVLSKLPFIGAAFRRTQQISQKTELVILLRPIVVSRKTWENDIEKTSQDFDHYRRGFHLGGLPEVFGTEGERENNPHPMKG